MRKPHSTDLRQGEKLPQPPTDLNNTHTPVLSEKAESLLAKEAVRMMIGLTIASGIGRTISVSLRLLFSN